MTKPISSKVFIVISQKIMKFNKNQDSGYFVNLGSQYGINKQTHLKNKYYPKKNIIFRKKIYSVPNDYDYVLTKIYGQNYMELPPIEKRVTHNPLSIKFEGEEEIFYGR